jgi:hypothetical protein
MAWLNVPIAILFCGISAALPLSQAEAQQTVATLEDAETMGTGDVSDEEGAEEAQEALCSAIETAASDHDLPVGFFTRLIWQESRFRADAVSPKGAQGIAQFMPATAAERGLADPFDARAAIPASASYLADLHRRFGNLGLAAAAYNAGPQRVGSWLSESGTLPAETQEFVLTITGLAAESWADPENEPALPAEPDDAKDCLALAALLKGPGAALATEVETAEAPWGVQGAGNFSRARAVAAYAELGRRFEKIIGGRPPMIVTGRAPGRGTRAFYRVRVPVETRANGEEICADLRRAGGNCVVLKS